MAALKKQSEAKGFTYRKGDAKEGKRYDFRYIPHLVIADDSGKKLYAFEAKVVVEAHKSGKLAETVLAKAAEFK